MTDLVKFIQNIVPKAIEDIDNDKLQIKVDEFSVDSFHQILNLMKQFKEEEKNVEDPPAEVKEEQPAPMEVDEEHKE